MEAFFSSPMKSIENDLLVFSHLRWDFVFQRPQHLLTRFARSRRRVFFFEEPQFLEACEPHYKTVLREHGIQLVIPCLPASFNQEQIWESQRELVDQLIEDEIIEDYTAWYYTPMALPFTRHLIPQTVVFDCMDELSAFKNAPPLLIELEEELMRLADVVFTGGHSLYEAKRHRHSNIHVFPSSIDSAHFRSARTETEPVDQQKVPHPRLGFFGVIDERMDLALISQMAKLRPDWHFVMIGPVVKIDPRSLPQGPNLHYLGKKDYQQLPKYLSGWDVAILPFARNESTKFISPTKTPEYLAAGRPVVSTSIQDVIRPYAFEDLVSIADTPEQFIEAAEKAMLRARTDSDWRRRVDQFLMGMSWDSTYHKMAHLEKISRARGTEHHDLTSDSVMTL